MVTGEDPSSSQTTYRPRFKPNASQVRPVANTKVVEWRKEAAVQGFPEAHLIGDAIVKPVEDVLCIGTLRCRG